MVALEMMVPAALTMPTPRQAPGDHGKTLLRALPFLIQCIALVLTSAVSQLSSPMGKTTVITSILLRGELRAGETSQPGKQCPP